MKSIHLFLSSVSYVLAVFLTCLAFGAEDIYDSGGPLMPQQAAYNVTYYDLSLYVNPSDSSIEGSVIVDAMIVHPLDVFVLDLDTLLSVTSVVELVDSREQSRKFNHEDGKIWMDLERTRQPKERISIHVFYKGRPRVAPRPPWNGGFTWENTADGSPWIATSCQGEGADIWWPNKDHVSDKPDSMRIHIRVPDPLIVASNGRLESTVSNEDKTTTYHWFVSTPISNYNVALNIAPYQVIEDTYTSVTDEEIPIGFWVLPEDIEKGEKFFPEILKHLGFYENLLGPYPFRADKYGVAQTPHLGMEHQTIIAYGARFNNSAMTMGKDWGFDALHHHELAHEWWGNVITCSDWRDMWIHEGFGTYMQALYLEKTQGKERYHEYLKSIRGFLNIEPVASVRSLTASEIPMPTVYFKGAWILHTLRYLLGTDTFMLLLRRMIYPTPEMEQISDGSQVRFVSTMDFLTLAESVSDMELDWFFDVYLRQPALPILVSKVDDNELHIRWEIPEDLYFPMPIDIRLGNDLIRSEIPSTGLVLTLEDGIEPNIDPENWVLYQTPFPDEIYLNSSVLDRFVGSYETEIRNRKRTIEISREGESLFVKSERLPKIQLYPSSATEFFTKVSDKIRIKFNLDDNDKIESVTYNLFPREMTYRKIN